LFDTTDDGDDGTNSVRAAYRASSRRRMNDAVVGISNSPGIGAFGLGLGLRRPDMRDQDVAPKYLRRGSLGWSLGGLINEYWRR